MDTLNLKKGESLDLKKSSPSIKNALIGAGWDVNDEENGKSFDLDLTVALVKGDGKAKDVVFFGNLKATGVEHTGDNLTGEGDGDDEQVKLDLTAIEAEIAKLVFIVNIYEAKDKGQDFGMVKSSFVRVLDADGNKELAKYDLQKEYAGKSGVVVAELNRTGDSWEFKAVGEGVDGDINEILATKGFK